MHNGQREPRVTERAKNESTAIEDLDTDEAEADKVKGGRLGDPCDGGE